MPVKEILYKLQPIQLYTVLILSCIYFIVQLIFSHLSHSNTLLVSCYHSLCNIIALTGCIFTLKHGDDNRKRLSHNSESSLAANEINSENPQQQHKELINNYESKSLRRQHQLKNTFGWTRIDVITMLIVCIFLASLCFSLLVEALQTLIHIDHQDAMHYPIPIIIIGVAGIILNGLCYLLIGGYSFRQGSFLRLSSKGEVVLNGVVTRNKNEIKTGSNETIESANTKSSQDSLTNNKRQNFHDVCRDVCSSIFVIICAVVIFFADEEIAKFIDPIISIVSCFLLLFLSYPYMKEAGLILLQTIPDSIDIECFKKNLLENFKDIVSIHDLHIWQLTSSKYVSTAHIIFHNPSVYSRIIDDILNYFNEQGINIVTIQPEFTVTQFSQNDTEETTTAESFCLVKCRQQECEPKHCCIQNNLTHNNACIKTRNETKQSRKTTANKDHVVAMKDCDETELKEVVMNPESLPVNTSTKSLYDSDQNRQVNKKISTVSLTVDHKAYQTTEPSSSEQGEAKLHKTHFYSESEINTDDSTKNNNQKIIVENKLLDQLEKTDNNETENLYNRCESDK